MKKAHLSIKTIYWALYSIMICLLATIIFRRALMPHPGQSFYQNHNHALDRGWQVYSGDKLIEQTAEIPGDFEVDPGLPVTVTRRLPPGIMNDHYIRILTNYQEVTVKINDRVVGSYNGADGFLDNGFPAKEYLMYSIRSTDSGKKIEITYNSPLPRYAGRLGSISYGTKADLILSLLSDNMFTIATSLISIVFGLFFMFYRLNPRDPEASHFYMGLFIFMMGVWYFSQIHVTQSYSGNINLSRAVEYISLMSISIPEIKFVNLIQQHRYEKLTSVLITAEVVIYALESALIFVFRYDYTKVVWLTHVMIICMIVYTFATLITTAFRDKELFGSIKWFYRGIMCLILGTIPSLVQFYALPSSYSSYIISTAILAFLYCSMRWAVSNISSEFKKREVAVQESAAKSGFLANMSHEIRTPINAIIGLNSLILKRTTNQKIYGYSVDMDISGRNLLSTVNDILLYSKLDSGKLTLIPEIYDTNTLIEDIRSEMKDIMKGKPIKFSITYHPSIPSSMYGDMERIKIVLMNLLRNSYKYTDSGYINMHLSGEISDGEDSIYQLHITVTDTGRGIEKEARKNLYEPFEHNNDQEGTGLGLPLVKMLVTLMDGTISEESAIGAGTSFNITIPQKVYSYKPMGIYMEEMNNSKKKNNEYRSTVKLLFADDNRVNLTVFKGLLGETGLVPDVVNSGKAAIEMTLKNHYDIIFLDYQMPEMNGLETLNAIRNNPKNQSRNTPAVVLTSGATDEDRSMLLSSGFAVYLEKPLEKNRLMRVLSNILKEEDKA